MSRDYMVGDDAAHPITPVQAYDAQYWYTRAEMTRQKARQRPHDENRLMKIASEYDRLAERAARIRVELEDTLSRRPKAR